MMQLYQTPGTIFTWGSFRAWLTVLRAIDGRRSSAGKHAAIAAHLRALPVALVYRCSCRETLQEVRATLKGPGTAGARPPRGRRAEVPQTGILMAVNNRLAQLDQARGNVRRAVVG